MHEEARVLLGLAAAQGSLTWDVFAAGWWRMVRRLVLGDPAREDHELTAMLRRLRGDANWAFLAPERRALRDRFLRRLELHLSRAEPGSLAALVAAAPRSGRTAPVEQVPQWLFAFDAAGMATFRALALLAAHPAEAERAREEVDPRRLGAPQELAFLRATLLESVRLWPTTPVILRDTTTETAWPAGTLAAGAALAIFAPYFHRDGRRLAAADAFAPRLWLDGSEPPEDWSLVPFSAGPAACPGRNLVLLSASSVLATVLASARLRLAGPRRMGPQAPLPATLSPFGLRFEVTA